MATKTIKKPAAKKAVKEKKAVVAKAKPEKKAPKTAAKTKAPAKKAEVEMPAPSEEKQEVISQYQVKEGDTGSPEVQVALLTKRIEKLVSHL